MADQDAAVKDAPKEEPAETPAATDSPPAGDQTQVEEPDTKVDQPSEESKTPAEPEAEGAKEEKPEQKPAEAKKESPRLQKRVRDLSQKLREARTPQTPQFDPNNPPTAEIPAGDYTPEQLSQMVNQKADVLSELKTQSQIQALRSEMEQERLLNNLARSVGSLEQAYPELNPDSDDFNPELTDAVGETIDEVFRANPYVDVETVASKMISASRAAGTSKAKQVGEKVAEQASNAAVRSTTSSKVEDKKFEDLSVEEMEEKLGKVQP